MPSYEVHWLTANVAKLNRTKLASEKSPMTQRAVDHWNDSPTVLQIEQKCNFHLLKLQPKKHTSYV